MLDFLSILYQVYVSLLIYLVVGGAAGSWVDSSLKYMKTTRFGGKKKCSVADNEFLLEEIPYDRNVPLLSRFYMCWRNKC